jgi:rhodanese-related sulfurtransferase
VTTLGQERKVNPLLTATDEAAFVQAFLSGLGSYPTYFTHLRAVNRQGARLYGSHLPELPRLSVADIERELAAGASLIDTRPYRDFAEGHIRGALSIALRPAFASWLGWLLPPDRALVFVMGDGQDRRDLVSQSLKIGYEDLRGELGDGMAAWLAANRPLATIALRQVGDDLGPHLLDVRQDSEWSGGHLAGAEHLELGSLISSAQRLPSGPMTVYCGHGERAMTAASLLEAHACRDLAVLDGGFEAWTKANNPVAVD